MSLDNSGGSPDPREVVHSVELGVELLKRAHGSLVRFHHEVGDGMDRLAEAEQGLRACGYDELADELRDEFLPRGVQGDRWSYEVLESFESDFMAEFEAFEAEVRETVVDGERHPYEQTLKEERTDRRAGDRGQ